MVILRPFLYNDWPVLKQHQYPGMSEEEIKKLISDFNSCIYQSRQVQVLAVESNGALVGYVSLYEQENDAASEGVEIFPPYRRQGFAFEALQQLFAQTFYRTITAQIRKDNTASLALHSKLGFQIVDEFVNRRGHPVYLLSLSPHQEIATSLRSSQ